MSSSIDRAMNQLILAIRDSDTYKEYMTQLERVKQQPELKKQIDDYRARNFELQTGSDVRFEQIDQFEKEYEGFRENPYVSDFLAAELAFCRMMQDINIRITEAMHFE